MPHNSHRFVRLGLFVALCALVMLPAAVSTVHAAVSSGYSEYYIPGRTEQMWAVFSDMDNKIAVNLGQATQLDAAQGMHSVISITVTGDNTTVYYDHWEDGYDFDPANPDATYDQKWVRNAGEVITLTGDNIPVNPRGTSVYYDGGDRIYVAGTSVTVSRASWTESAGPVFALAWELFPIKPFLTDYTVPVGLDLAGAPKNYSDFERVYVLVQSVYDNNPIQIDDPNTPYVDVTTTLSKGETTQLFDVNAGTRIHGDLPVQVHIVVGSDTRDRYECRGFNAMPEALWDNEYYSPVPGANNGNTDIYLYNPHTTAIIISYEDTTGSGSFTIPARDTVSYRDGAGRFVPVNSGVYLRSDNVFWGISSVDTESRTYDWGFDLVPVNFLTDEYFLSWAPGTSEDAPTSNGSPAFVTPVFNDTVIFIDYSPTDGIIDQTVTRDRLQTLKVFDPDNVNTGTHIFANGPIVVAWGQDPDSAGTGNPYLDLGVANLPMPPAWIDQTLGLEKTADPTVLPPVAGETTTFTVTVKTFDFPVATLSVKDMLPAGFSFVNNTAVITLPDNSVITGAAANPAITGQTLTWSNATLANLNMAANETLTVIYQVVIDGTVGQGQYTNEAQASGTRLMGSQIFSPFDNAVIDVTPVTIDKDTLTPSVQGGATADYQVRIKNISDTQAVGVTLNDVLPTGFTYNSQVSYAETAGVTRTATSAPTAGAGTLNWGTWTLDSQGQATIVFRVNVASTVLPGTYDNTVSAAGTWGGSAFAIDDRGKVAQDLGTPSGEDPETDEDVTVVSLTVDMDTDPTPYTVAAGSQATYTITVKNDGASTITGATLSAALPPGFTYASTTSAVGSSATRSPTTNPTVGTANPQWGTWSISPGGSVVLTFVANVAASVPPGTYDASAFVNSTQTGLIDDAGPVAQDEHTPAGLDPEDDEDVTVQTAVLTIDKDAIFKYAVRGVTPVTWEIVVRNPGTATATNVVITDTLPAGFTFNSNVGVPIETLATRASFPPSSDPASGATSLSWGTWTIQPGGSVAVRFKADVAGSVAAGTYSNTAGVTSTQTGFLDDIGTVAQDTGTPSFMDPVDDEDVIIFASPTEDAAVTITHTQPVDTYDVIYSVNVTNNGPSDEPGPITVVVTLPVGIDYKTYSPTADYTLASQVGQVLTFTYGGSLAVGASLPTLVVNTEFNATVVPVDAKATAVVSGTITDYAVANNTAIDPFKVTVADLSTSTKTVFDINGGDVEPGDILEYTITLIETGDKKAKSVSVTDDIPANVNTFTVVLPIPAGATDSSTPTGGTNGTGYLNITGFDVAKLSQEVIKFRVTVNAAAPNGTIIANTAVVTNPKGIGAPSVQAPQVVVRGSTLPAQGQKPLYLNQSTQLVRTPPTAPQSAVEVTSGGNRTWTMTPASQSPLAVSAGAGTIPVTLTVRNGYDGTWTGSTTHAITVTLGYSGAATGTIGNVTQNLSLQNFVDTTTTFNVPISGNLALPTGTALTLRINQTNAGYGDPLDVFPISTGAVVSRAAYQATTVINVDSVAFYSAAYPGGSVVTTTTPGASLYVRAVVSDPFGSSDISGATLDMVDSEGTVRLSAAAMTQVADSGLATKTYERAYTFPAAGPVDYWTASVTAAEGSEGTVTDGGVAAVNVLPASGADLSITKTHSGTFARGANGTFTIRATNNGPAAQTANIVVTDIIPSGMTYVSSTGTGWSVNVVGSTVTWTYAASAGSPVAAGTILPAITLTVAVAGGAPATIQNTATVDLGVGENNPGNNTATDTVSILDLAVSKTVNAGSPYYAGDKASPADELTYTVNVTNASTAPIYKVTVRDLLPAGLTYVSGSTQVSAPDHRIRVTEYFIGAGEFTGTIHELVLKQNLAPDYFVIVQGSAGDGTQNNDIGADANYAALVGDPFGTGDLTGLSRPDAIRFYRNTATNSWMGVVTVVESLDPANADAFRLRDALQVTHNNGTGSGTATSAAWSDLSKVMLVGGFNGAGASSTQATVSSTRNSFVRFYPSGTNTINWVRGNSQGATTSTVMVVEWGANWNVQRSRVQGNNGGNGANATNEYNTAAITSVARANTWVWGTGYTNDNGIGDAAEGVLLTLGNGVTQNTNETLLAAGIEYNNNAVDFEVYALTHGALRVQHIFKPDGDATNNIVDVDYPGAAVKLQGYGMALSYNGQGATNTTYPRPMLSARFIDTDTIRLERRRYGTDFPAWVQGIDFSQFKGATPVVRTGNAPPYLVAAADGYSLQPGESMTVTFRATIAQPTVPGTLTNSVLVSADGFADTAVATRAIEVRTFGDPNFTDAAGNLVPGNSFNYSGAATVPAYLKLVDKDRNTNANGIDTVTVRVTNPLNGDVVIVTLYETGVNTGIFANNSSGQRYELPIIACAVPADCLPTPGPSDPPYPDPANVLYVAPGTNPTLQLYYEDPADTTRDKKTATAFVATLVVLSDVGAYEDGGRSVVYWETASEVGTAAFNIFRRDDSSSAYMPVNARPVASLLGTPHGGIYRLVDPSVRAGQSVSYLIEEIEARGQVNRYGPYSVTVGSVPDKIAVLAPLDGDFARDAHGSNGLPPPARRMALFSRAAFASTPATGDAIKISITSDGLYFVDAAQIEALLGLDSTTVSTLLAEGQLALSRAGRAVPYQPAADNSGLYFYAVALDSIYSGTNVYWLRPGTGQVIADTGTAAGDVTGTDGVTLADAIVSLQVASGIGTGVRGNYAASGADVNGNNRVDLAEALYVIQSLAGARPVAGGGGALSPAPGGQSFTAKIHMEQDVYALTDYFTDPQSDFWVKSYTQTGFGPIFELLAIPLEGDAGTGPVTAAVHLYGAYDDPLVALDHHVKVFVTTNGGVTLTEVGDGLWDGIAPHTIITGDLRPLLGPPGTTYLVMADIPDTGAALNRFALDAIDVTYLRTYAAAGNRLAFTGGGNTVVTVSGFTGTDIRVFDVTDPHFPQRVTETLIDGPAGNYQVTFKPDTPETPYVAVLADSLVGPATLAAVTDSDLRQSTNAYDYLVIAPAEFLTEAQRLVDYRRNQGLAGRAVSFEEIVDTFNHGLYSPEAIKEFLTFARGQWQRAPQFVVLAGNGTYDYKNNENKGDNKLPTMLVGTANGLFASDQTQADITGDGVPDLAIGRLPATSQVELGAMIDQALAFESGSGPWRTKAIMSAGGAEHAGETNNFKSDSDSVAVLLPSGLSVVKVYKDDSKTHTDLVAAINGGAVLFNYLGHGGYDRLAGYNPSAGIASLLDLFVDVPNLTNGTQRPVLTALTCIVGNYGIPGVDTLGEAMLKWPAGGAIAVWSPSGLSINENAVWLDQEYARQLSAAVGERRLGSMILQSLRNYSERSGDTHLTAIYNLLGDPALIMPAFSD
ncbi:MAG: C25 family cysteine peptidase [Pseudomonadota bacterium]